MIKQYFTRIARTLDQVLKKIKPPVSIMSAEVTKRKPDDRDVPDGGQSKKARTESAEGNVRKRKVAMLMVYSGKGYYGMQRTGQGLDTIEDELAKALLLAEAISQDSHDTLQKMSFQRAARTDKGVSAAGQVVSLKMRTDIENLVEKINSFLKPQIRVLDFKRTTKGFNCKNWCSARTYSYMMPTFGFAPVEETVLESYRVTPEILEQVNSLLGQYKGTHNFHNFTSGKKPNDPSAKRYIMDMSCGPAFERDGLEWVVIKVKGQSFMIHQIRKMIGMVIAMVRGLASNDCIERAWNETKFDVPKAPGLGLMLEELHYEQYNKMYGSDGVHEAIEWSKFKDQIDKFKEEYIYSTMIETEKNEKSMLEWMSTLHLHLFTEKEPGTDVSDMAVAARKIMHLNKDKKEEESASSKDDNNLSAAEPSPGVDDSIAVNTENTATDIEKEKQSNAS